MSIVTEDWTMPSTAENADEFGAHSATSSYHPTAGNKAAKWATAIILIGSSILIFARLGHYALWDDEAITAMTARGVWRTGDTSAWADDHNLVAYRNGLLINHFADRYTPPLQFYLLAPFMGLLGESNFVCRLPFALCGVITVGLMLRWLWRLRPPPLVWWSTAFFILTNASFFLFQRNCRYYALATVLSVAVAYLYYKWNTGHGPVWTLAVALAVLLSAQYLNYAAAVACLVFDYAVWGRKRRQLTGGDWLVLILPQLVVGGVVCSIWNPFARGVAASMMPHVHTWLGGLLAVFWWNWRDMLASDFIALPLLLFCPLLYLKRRNNWMLRAPAALCVYLATIATCMARMAGDAGMAEVRYLAPLLPLCITISILAVWGLAALKRKFFIAGLCVAAVAMMIEPSSDGGPPVLGSTAIDYYRELWHPQQEPYTPMVAWIKANVPAGKSILARPDWMAYPLMFRASRPIYAWQLTEPPKPEYANLPDIYFDGRIAPDYLIAFGPFTRQIGEIRALLVRRGIQYNQIDTIHTYWKDEYRPERIWRTFVTPEIQPGEEIYIYRRIDQR